jgi:hypothetical protein
LEPRPGATAREEAAKRKKRKREAKWRQENYVRRSVKDHCRKIYDRLKNPDIVFHNPAQHPLPPGAGQPVTQVKDSSGKVTKTSGTTSGVVHNNPA